MTEPIPNYSWPPHFRSGQSPPPAPPPNPADTPVSVAGNLTTTSHDNNLNPDGRVSKPIRRRTRASRRTPTTLLSTDTRNFRAMVQQFTGGPSVSLPPFMSQNQTTPAPAPATIEAAYNYQLLQQNQNYQMFSFAGNRGGGIGRSFDQDSGEIGRINLAGSSGFTMEDLISHHGPRGPPSSN